MQDDKLQLWLELALKTLKTEWLAYALISPVFVLVVLKLFDAQGFTHPILQSLTFSIVGLCCLACCTAIAFSAYWDCSPLRSIDLALPRLFKALLPGGMLILVTAVTVTYFVVDRAFEYSGDYPAWIWASITPWILSTGVGFTFTPHACVYGDKHGSILERAKPMASTLPYGFTSLLMFSGLILAVHPVAYFLLMPFMACLMVVVFMDTTHVENVV